MPTHDHFMKRALDQAIQAQDEGEVPVGAVVVSNGRIIGRGHNQTERLQDATAHAEMIAITAASEFIGDRHLHGCTLYVTMEPCLMCGGAIFWSQLSGVVYGADDPRQGFQSTGHNPLPRKVEVIPGILDTDCRALLDRFFEGLRRRN